MDFSALAAECAPWVAPQTMAAIVRTESQFNPLAININGRAKLERQPVNKQEAVVTAKWLIANNYNIDMGLGQVNSVNLAKTNLSVDDAFDECKNLAAAATILKWNYDSASKRIVGEQAALNAAISAYNTGSFTKGFSNGYVRKVVSNARIASPSEAPMQQPVALPIPLVNSLKRDAVQLSNVTLPANVSMTAEPAIASELPASDPEIIKVKNESVDGFTVPAVKLKNLNAESKFAGKLAKDSADLQYSIYESQNTEQNVMVYH